MSIVGQIGLAKEMIMYNDSRRWHEYQRVCPAIMRAVKNAENEGSIDAAVLMTHKQRKSCQRPLRQKRPPVTVRVRIHDRKNRFTGAGR